MADETFVARVRLPVSAEAAFAWHERPGALQRLSPPWESVEVISASGGLEPGARVELELKLGPFRPRWVAVHGEKVPGRSFRDRQESGPFARWEHTHRFEPEGRDACRLLDEVTYRLPLAPFSHWVTAGLAPRLARRKIERLFAYRQATTRADLAATAGDRPLRVLVSGASGLVGSALVPFLTTAGHTVSRLVRDPSQRADDAILWDPARGTIEADRLAGFDAVVHLAGENIAGGRWTAARKAAIRDSRVAGTRLLASTLARRPDPPRVFVSASAIGYYGERGDERLGESAPPGVGFLPETCRDWEREVEPARAAGLRTAQLRIGLVLDPRGGALARMLTPFRLGVAGRLGSGRQWMSWISLDDLLGVIHRALVDERVSGPLNAVAPRPVTNAEFTATLARVLRRPAWLPAPAAALRLALGEMAQDLLLASIRVEPAALARLGHEFRHPALEGALRHMLGRGGSEPDDAAGRPAAPGRAGRTAAGAPAGPVPPRAGRGSR